jgi:hypothetical protein
LWSSEESLQQGSPVYFAAFLRIHHVNKLLGGPLKVLQLLLALVQLLLLLLLLFAQRLDLLKAVDDCCFVSAITFCSLSTSSVRRYSIFFTSVSNSSLYVKIFLSSAVKTVSELKINC